MKKWTIGKPDPQAVSLLQNKGGLSRLCASVLAARGLVTMEAAAANIGCQELGSPFLLCEMQEAADCINAAMDSGKKICVYGDYDCDGIMATAILYTFLLESGADVIWRIPERTEGYGLNETAVREMHEAGVQLIITVDNGISAIQEAKLIAELGMELVVTDHHQPGPELPRAAAVVDAHREDNFSPFRLYCGAGIALLLAAALNDGDTAMAMEQFGDLAAIATVGDVVSLTGENRYIVHMGLQYLENTERPGLRALREISCKAGTQLSAVSVAFTLVPRINAAGRMASPALAMELLLVEDPHRAKEIAEEIQALNTVRRETEAQIVESVLQQIAEDPRLLYERVLIFSGNGWHRGIIGIVASRMEERFGKPCFIISIENGIATGSARSFGAFSVFGCLSACKDLLIRFGGHPAAGGFSLKEELLPRFREAVAAYSAEHHPDMPVMEMEAVCRLTPDLMTVEETESLMVLEPFGAGNPEPIFLIENAVILKMDGVSGNVHTRFLLDIQGKQQDAILFRTDPAVTGLRAGDICHLLVKIQVSEFMSSKKISLVVQDYRKAGVNQGKYIAARQSFEKYRRDEMLPAPYYAAMYPSREECMLVYRAVPRSGIRIEQLAEQMLLQGMNYCKVRICLDVFQELGIMQVLEGEGKAMQLPARSKVRLEDSQILRAIAARMNPAKP